LAADLLRKAAEEGKIAPFPAAYAYRQILPITVLDRPSPENLNSPADFAARLSLCMKGPAP
jgi:hypothetical protein